MSSDITFSDKPGQDDFRPALTAIARHIKAWFKDNGWSQGLLKMLAGAAVLAIGVKTGVIQASWEMILHLFTDGEPMRLLGGTLGAILGSVSALAVGSIGIVACGTGFGIPALVLAAVAALVFCLTGMSVGELLHGLLSPLPSLTAGLSGFGLLGLGVWLLKDGAQTLLDDPKVRRLLARLG